MDIIPNAVSLTVYSGGAEDFMRTPLQSLVEQVEAGTLRIHVGRVFHLFLQIFFPTIGPNLAH